MTSPARLEAMERAVREGRVAKVRLLLKAGVPADGGTRSRFVDLAALCGQLEVLDLLVEHGAHVDLAEVLPMVAERDGDPVDVVRRLLELGSPSAELLSEARQFAVNAGNPGVASLLGEGDADGPAAEGGALDAVPERLLPAVRQAWLPVLARGEDDPLASKFCGIPRLGPGDEWPECGYCNQPLQLVLQLDLERTPLAGLFGPDGFLQVFYCCVADTYCDQAGDDLFSPFGGFMGARVHAVGADAAQAVVDDRSPTAFVPARITDWTARDDYPTPEEPAGNTGVALTASELDALHSRWASAERGERAPLTWVGDKLLGWPVWPQDYTPTLCPDCGETMPVIAQIASNEGVPFAFGDGGIGRVTRCAQHPERLGFGWAGS